MGVITYPATPYHKLKRQQLLTLTYALEDMRDRAIKRAETAEADVDPDDCSYDHHGDCQAHGFFGSRCGHAVAKELLGGGAR